MILRSFCERSVRAATQCLARRSRAGRCCCCCFCRCNSSAQPPDVRSFARLSRGDSAAPPLRPRRTLYRRAKMEEAGGWRGGASDSAEAKAQGERVLLLPLRLRLHLDLDVLKARRSRRGACKAAGACGRRAPRERESDAGRARPRSGGSGEHAQRKACPKRGAQERSVPSTGATAQPPLGLRPQVGCTGAPVAPQAHAARADTPAHAQRATGAAAGGVGAPWPKRSREARSRRRALEPPIVSSASAKHEHAAAPPKMLTDVCLCAPVRMLGAAGGLVGGERWPCHLRGAAVLIWVGE